MKYKSAVCISFVTLFLSSTSSAEKISLCGRDVEFAIEPPSADVPPDPRAFSGVWLGRNQNGRCIAMIFESVQADGTARYVGVWQYLSPNEPGGVVRATGKIEGKVLRRKGQPDGNIQLRNDQYFTLKSPTEIAYETTFPWGSTKADFRKLR
jgi:hypothetical protein